MCASPVARRLLRDQLSPPEGLGALQQLTRLQLLGASALPLGLLGALGAGLVKLECDNCRLVEGPTVITGGSPWEPLLPRLTELRLEYCNLARAPRLLAHTPQLRRLRMAWCGLQALPVGLGWLAHLSHLELWRNPWGSPSVWEPGPPPRLPRLPALREVHWVHPRAGENEGSEDGQEEPEGQWGEAEYRESGGAAWAYF